MPTSETSQEILEPAQMLEREPALVAMLDEAELKVDAVLEAMPQAFVEARRLIGRELWSLPRPEELQTIIKIASDHAKEGPRRDLPRRFIALRLVAEDISRAYWDPMVLDPGAIWCRAQDLRVIVEAVERLEAMLEPGPGASGEVAIEDRVYLKTVARALAPRRDLISAAITLAHPLVEIMEMAGVDDVRERIPSLTNEELALLRRAAAGEEAGGPERGVGATEPASDGVESQDDTPADPGADPARRHIVLEVLTVRSLIHGDVAEWEALFQEAAAMQEHADAPAGDDAPASDPPSSARAASDASEAHRDELAEALAAASASFDDDAPKTSAADISDDDDAVWVVEEDDADEEAGPDGRVLPAADAATPEAAGPADPTSRARLEEPAAPAPTLSLTHEQAERRVVIHRRALEHQVLYGVVSERLQKIQDEALLTRQKETTEWLAAFRRPLVASYSRLLTVVRNQTPGAAAPGMAFVPDDEPGETYEDVFEKAISHTEDLKAAAEADKAGAPVRRERKRRVKRLALMATAIVGLSGIAVGVRYMLPTPPPPALAFSPSEARNVISLSETRPIGSMLYAKLQGRWDAFSNEEREREIVSLARIASDRGFTSLYLVEDSGEPLAEWDPLHGPRLYPKQTVK